MEGGRDASRPLVGQRRQKGGAGLQEGVHPGEAAGITPIIRGRGTAGNTHSCDVAGVLEPGSAEACPRTALLPGWPHPTPEALS